MNKFSLFCVYNTDTPPCHDPEDPYLVKNMCSLFVELNPANVRPLKQVSDNSYYPYLDESSMRLKHWYWNQGMQKSKESFKQLLDIIGEPCFSPSVISQTSCYNFPSLSLYPSFLFLLYTSYLVYYLYHHHSPSSYHWITLSSSPFVLNL